MIIKHIREILISPEVIAKVYHLFEEDDRPIDKLELARTLQNVNAVWDHLFPAEQARICKLLVEKAVIHQDNLEVHIRDCGITALAEELIANEEVAA